MKKTFLSITIFGLFLSSCSSLVSDEMIQTAIAKTQNSQSTTNYISPTNTSIPTITYTKTPKPTATIKPTATQPPEYYLGDTVIENEIAFTSISIEDPYICPNCLLYPAVGYKYVSVTSEIHNLSANDIFYNSSSSSCQIKDQNGYAYPVKSISPDDVFFLVGLAKGEKIRQFQVFEIPIDSEPITVQTSVGFFNPILINSNLRPAPDEHITNTLLSQPYTINSPQSQIEMMINDFNESATPLFYTPLKQGFKFVAFNVEIINLSAQNPLNIYSGGFYLIDSEGLLYPTYGTIAGEIQPINLNKGERTKGWVIFKIPENITPIGIKFGNSPDEKYVYATYP